MRCRPGDLAAISVSAAGNHGRIVEVIDDDVYGLSGSGADVPKPLWRVRSLSGPLNNDLGFSRVEFAFPDAWLRPLRDPGDDAVDETLLWKPVPSEVTTC